MNLRWMFTTLLIATLPTMAQTGYADLVEDIQDAIVNIRTTQTVQQSRRGNPFNFFGMPDNNPHNQEAAGSGFLISRDGYIVTNRHVVEDADSITVFTTDLEEHQAELIGTDENLDIALLKIDGDSFKHLKLGDSKKLRIGDPVLAIGYPLQLGFSVTAGIVSGIGRNLRSDSLDLATYIQTDADITFGNSGGPLVNPRGEVMAINTLIVTRGETYGFAIPTELFASSIEQLKVFGEVRRGALGVSVQNLSQEAQDYYNIDYGALVRSVTRGLPADKAGIQTDQVILNIDGDKVSDSSDLIAKISKKAPGDKIELAMMDTRGKKFSKTVTLTDRRRLADPNRPLEAVDRDSDREQVPLGITIAPIDSRFRRQMDLGEQFSGVKVEEVERGSIAERNGIQTNQIITEVDHKKVNSVKDVLKILKDIPDKQVFPVRVVTFISNGFAIDTQERTVFLREK